MDELVLATIADFLVDSEFKSMILVWYDLLVDYIARRKLGATKYYGSTRYYSNGYSDNFHTKVVSISDTWGVKFNRIPIEPDTIALTDNDSIIGFYKPSTNIYSWTKPIPELFYEYRDVVPNGTIFENHEYVMRLCYMGIWTDETRHIVRFLKQHQPSICIDGNDKYQILLDGTIICDYHGRVLYSIGLCHIHWNDETDELICLTPDTDIIVGSNYIYDIGTLNKEYLNNDQGCVIFQDIMVFYATNKHKHPYIIDVRWNA